VRILERLSEGPVQRPRVRPDRYAPIYGTCGSARSIPPTSVEETIRSGIKKYVVENEELRTIHTLGTIMVVTTRDDRIVITVGNRH
jgi:hypothetical protein